MTISVSAGDRVTDEMLNAFVPKYLLQGSDQTLNTTTFTAHNTFASIAVGAGEIWEFCFNLVIGDSTVASGIKTRLSATGDVTTGYRHIVAMGVTATTANDATNVSVQARTLSSSVSHGVTNSASTFATLQEKMLVNGGATGGTVTLEWACVAASGNVIVKSGGHMIAHRVS